MPVKICRLNFLICTTIPWSLNFALQHTIQLALSPCETDAEYQFWLVKAGSQITVLNVFAKNVAFLTKCNWQAPSYTRWKQHRTFQIDIMNLSLILKQFSREQFGEVLSLFRDASKDKFLEMQLMSEHRVLSLIRTISILDGQAFEQFYYVTWLCYWKQLKPRFLHIFDVFTKKIRKNFISAQYTTIVYSCMFLGICLWFLKQLG